MTNDKNLQFITRSITDAGQVMLYRHFNSGNKQAIGIKTDFHIDEGGVLHFALNTHYEENITTEFFPVDMFIYKKGKPFYLTAHGFAQKNTTSTSKNISVKMDMVEFVEITTHKQNGYLKNIIAKGSKIMSMFI